MRQFYYFRCRGSLCHMVFALTKEEIARYQEPWSDAPDARVDTVIESWVCKVCRTHGAEPLPVREASPLDFMGY